MMKIRHLLVLLLTAGCFSCSNESGSITGSWVIEMPDQPQHKQGFTLKEDGRAVAINMGYMNFEKWEKQGDKLILSGKKERSGEMTDFKDTLKIIAVADSMLTVEKGGQQIRYYKAIDPDKLVNDFEIYECFVYQTKKDSAFMHVNVADSVVTGELVYALFQKDRNQGRIDGVMRGDTLLARYTFVSEGTESVREVVFLKKGTGWLEGFGEVKDSAGVMFFKDRSRLKFGRGPLFKGVKCPPAIE